MNSPSYNLANIISQILLVSCINTKTTETSNTSLGTKKDGIYSIFQYFNKKNILLFSIFCLLAFWIFNFLNNAYRLKKHCANLIDQFRTKMEKLDQIDSIDELDILAFNPHFDLQLLNNNLRSILLGLNQDEKNSLKISYQILMKKENQEKISRAYFSDQMTVNSYENALKDFEQILRELRVISNYI